MGVFVCVLFVCGEDVEVSVCVCGAVCSGRGV